MVKIKRSFIKHIIALLLFGTNGIVASHIDQSSHVIVLIRTFIGSLFLIMLFLISKRKINFFKCKHDSIFMILSGVAMAASWMFLYEAYQEIGVSLATIIYYCGPIIVMVVAPILFHEEVTWNKIVGFLIVLIGIICVNGKSLMTGKNSWGLFCGVMSALTYAVMVITNKKAKSMKGLENSMLQLSFSFVTVALYVVWREGFHLQIQPNDWLPILILGLMNTGVGCYFYFSSIGELPVQTVAICGYIEPLSAVVFSTLFLHESMASLQILGAVCILGGAILGEMQMNRKDHRKRRLGQYNS